MQTNLTGKKFMMNFVRCLDCNKLKIIPVADYQYCPLCNGTDIILYTFVSDNIEELRLMDGITVTDETMKDLLK